MQFDDMTKMSMLYDFYGVLLPEKQQNIFKLYHEDNLSLAEIAEEALISRQGVHDALKKAENALYEYEEKLALMQKYQKNEAVVAKAQTAINKLVETMTDQASAKELKKIKKQIEQIEL